jgi:serine/threonine protein kinase
MMHRDIKPENFLVKDPSDSQSTPNNLEAPWSQRVLKLIDFGSAKDINDTSSSPFTDYVGTRWYRAPELILGSKNYDATVDIFAVGCIMAELYLGRPIFPGQNAQD